MALAAGDSWLEKGATILLFGPPGHETYETLAAITATRTTAQWLDLLRDADIPHSEVVSFDALFEDEHLKATGLFYTYEHPTEGKLRGVGIPTRFSRTPGSIRLFPSALTSSSKGQPSEEKQQ
nr:CoA transferase [Paraburkholderia sp. BL8N3]